VCHEDPPSPPHGSAPTTPATSTPRTTPPSRAQVLLKQQREIIQLTKILDRDTADPVNRKLEFGSSSGYVVTLIVTMFSWFFSFFKLPDTRFIIAWIIPAVMITFFVSVTKKSCVVIFFTVLLGSMQDMLNVGIEHLKTLTTLGFSDVYSFAESRLHNCVGFVHAVFVPCSAVATSVTTFVGRNYVYFSVLLCIVYYLSLGRYVWANIRTNIVGGCFITVLMITVVLQPIICMVIYNATPTVLIGVY
jgi:hypothetical protein